MAIPGDSMTMGGTVHVVRARCGVTWDCFVCLSCAAFMLTMEELDVHMNLEGGHIIAGRCELHGLECRSAVR